MIVQNVGRGGKANLTFTVSKDDAAKAEKVLRAHCEAMKGSAVSITGDIAKVSVIGTGMRSHSGVAAKFFQTLAENSINVQIITTSEIKISVGHFARRRRHCGKRPAYGIRARQIIGRYFYRSRA